MIESPRRWGIWPSLWALSLAILGVFLLAAGTADAKRIKIPVTEERSPEDSLAYQLEPFPYLIAPGDELHVDYGIILDREPIVADVVVRPDGAVSLPRVGTVLVAGRSTTEVDSILAVLYADVYVDPNIAVAVRRVAGNLVHVLGQVARPGSYPVSPNMTALQAVASAGGFKDDAAKGSVVVLRRTGENSLITRQINLDRAVHDNAASQDVFLRRYDIVYVDRNAIGNLNLFVDRFFAKMIPIPALYLQGWAAFNTDRVYPNTNRIIVDTP
jgi:protein involved in polysaccharide export with SLBB domain